MKSRVVTVVTAKTVRDAARLGEIFATAADRSMTCLACHRSASHGHMLEEHCAAAAIGASEEAARLWLRTSNAIATSPRARSAEIEYAPTLEEKQRLIDLYAWVDRVCGPIADNATAELTAVAVLYEGKVPPEWNILDAGEFGE